jgi:phosphoesterase RecJ-like protein
MRSKGDVDVRAVAAGFGGGGHKNAAGCSASGPLPDLMARVRGLILAQVDRAASNDSVGTHAS